MSCDLRSERECTCGLAHCAVQPQPTPAPVVLFTVRDRLTVIAFGAVMAGIAYLALSEADSQFKAENLRNQENVSWN